MIGHQVSVGSLIGVTKDLSSYQHSQEIHVSFVLTFLKFFASIFRSLSEDLPMLLVRQAHQGVLLS